MNQKQFNDQKMTMRKRKELNLHRPGPNMGFIPFAGKGLLANESTKGAFGMRSLSRVRRVKQKPSRGQEAFESRVTVAQVAPRKFQVRMQNGQIRNLVKAENNTLAFSNCGETFKCNS